MEAALCVAGDVVDDAVDVVVAHDVVGAGVVGVEKVRRASLLKTELESERELRAQASAVLDGELALLADRPRAAGGDTPPPEDRRGVPGARRSWLRRGAGGARDPRDRARCGGNGAVDPGASWPGRCAPDRVRTARGMDGIRGCRSPRRSVPPRADQREDRDDPKGGGAAGSTWSCSAWFRCRVAARSRDEGPPRPHSPGGGPCGYSESAVKEERPRLRLPGWPLLPRALDIALRQYSVWTIS